MDRKSLLKDIIIYLQSSKMGDDEKTAWMAMFPYMETSYLQKLLDVLKREVDSFTNKYLNAFASEVYTSPAK